MKHGTNSGYSKGCRCDDCKSANKAYRKAWAERRRASIPHGTTNGYANYGCRCDPCKAAHSARVKGDNARHAGERPTTHGVDGYKRFGCRCSICVEATRKGEREATARRRSLPDAPRRGYQWTGPELEILATRDDLSPREKAQLLGRTVRATEKMLHLVRHDPKWMKVAGVDDA